MKNISNIKLSFNSPVILWFTFICLIALILNRITGGFTNNLLFSVYRSSPLNPLTYIRLVGHVFGHSGFSHFMGNIMLLLIVGPLLEEKYGSADIIFTILTTAVVTGLVNIIFFSNVQLLGASGVVFAFIILASFSQYKAGEVPLTFIIVAVLYIGQQVYQGVFIQDNVSNLTHIIGGLTGGILGFVLNKK